MVDLWSVNRITVFYLYECITDVSQKELAPSAQEEMSGKKNEETQNIQGV